MADDAPRSNQNDGPAKPDPAAARQAASSYNAGKVDLGPLPRRLGRYEVLARIGAGGMGTVFRARQIPMDRIVALKVLASSLSKDKRYLRRFVREARAAGALDHPNIVRVHDVGNAEGYPYICMEFIDGQSVEKLLRERERLSPAEAVEVTVRVAEALEHAHRAGIIHCDIKPDNIIIDKQGMAKLADLGLARSHSTVSAESGTFHGIGMGTPHYVSMEQARDIRNADARSDIYSLGATLYHMVTGRVPYDGKSPVDIVMRLSRESVVKPEELAPGVPPSLSAVIDRMMARSPDERYQDASTLLHDLSAVRSELAGLGPAVLLSRAAKHTPPKTGGDMLYVLAGSVAAVALAGAIANGFKPVPEAPVPVPTFSGRALKAAGPVKVSVGEPSIPKPPPVDPPDPPEVRPPVVDPPVAPPPSANTRAIDVALRRSRWSSRAGRYGDATEAMTRFAASARDRDREMALAAIVKLQRHAEEESAVTLKEAERLLGAGRVEKALFLLRRALRSWGIPVLEAKAEDALNKAMELSENIDWRRRDRAIAEKSARHSARRAETLARTRRFTEARAAADRAVVKLEGTGSPMIEELRLRATVFGVLADTHTVVVKRLSRSDRRIRASEVLDDWPSPEAIIAGADGERIYVVEGGMRAGRRWRDLSAVEYARLAALCSRTDKRREVLGVGLAWIEANRPAEALKVWRASKIPPEDYRLTARPGSAMSLQVLEKARALDASGKEREALEVLTVASRNMDGGVLPDETQKFMKSLKLHMEASAGLNGGYRKGPDESIELIYEFSRPGWNADWTTSGTRLRQSPRCVVSPSGSRSSLEFMGSLVAGWEAAISVKFLEGADCAVEISLVPDEPGAVPSGTLRLNVEEVARAAADGRQQPLARTVYDVIVFRRWDKLCWGVESGGGTIRFDRSLPVSPPRGPERLVVRLVGWMELSRIQLSGVVDPSWLSQRRGAVAGEGRGEDRTDVVD